MAQNVLILGGTRDAYRLAERLDARGVAVTTALAGVTDNPRRPAGRLHVGGFGGTAGLAAHLRSHGFTHLIDATHPYAAQISANAVGAARQAGVPLIRLSRPEWTPPPGADWREFDELDAALAALPEGARVLATIGSKNLEQLLGWTNGRLFIRMLAAPKSPVPGHAEILIGRPPIAEAEEERVMRNYGITHLLTKNSGGSASWAKITAASQLGLPILVLRRPLLPAAPEVFDLDAVEAFIHSASP